VDYVRYVQSASVLNNLAIDNSLLGTVVRFVLLHHLPKKSVKGFIGADKSHRFGVEMPANVRALSADLLIDDLHRFCCRSCRP